jgi:hypothetical protein
VQKSLVRPAALLDPRIFSSLPELRDAYLCICIRVPAGRRSGERFRVNPIAGPARTGRGRFSRALAIAFTLGAENIGECFATAA